ncbi:MAG: NnrS family protein [Halieaceae bacterium]
MNMEETAPSVPKSPLWRMPFRPLFPAAAAFGSLAILAWLLQFQGVLGLGKVGLLWHMHEMIVGFAATVVVGFVLTAAQTWTGVPTIRGAGLQCLALLWLLARLGWVLPVCPDWLAAGIDVLFFLLAAWTVGRMTWLARNWRNVFFAPVFLLFAAFSGAYALVLERGDTTQAGFLLNGALFLIIHIVLVVGGRVIPFFSDRGLQRAPTVRYALLEYLSLLASALFLLLLVLEVSPVYLRVTAGLVALANLLRWLSWKPWQSLGVPLLWSLHIAYACVIAGFALWALDLPRSAAIHLLALGGFGLMILAMISRVSLGHTGRPLQLPAGFALAYILMIVAILSRVAASLMPEYYFALLWLAALGWMGAYSMFLYFYLPMLASARPDGGMG